MFNYGQPLKPCPTTVLLGWNYNVISDVQSAIKQVDRALAEICVHIRLWMLISDISMTTYTHRPARQNQLIEVDKNVSFVMDMHMVYQKKCRVHLCIKESLTIHYMTPAMSAKLTSVTSKGQVFWSSNNSFDYINVMYVTNRHIIFTWRTSVSLFSSFQLHIQPMDMTSKVMKVLALY
jgi:hypothetical protein